MILDDWTNTLRVYGPGQSGEGLEITSNIALAPGSTGFSPADTMIEIDLDGPACIGSSWSVGPGLAGTGGLVPELGVLGCPSVGELFALDVDDAAPGAPGLLLVGLSTTPLPFAGGTLYPIPLLTSTAIAADGAGGLLLPLSFANPASAGLGFTVQAAFIDLGAPQWLSLTNGLRVVIG